MIHMDKAVELLQYGFQRGINYVDTAYFYNGGMSEVAVGKAIKGWRDRVYLSSKSPGHLLKKRGDYRRVLEEQLQRLQEDNLDFYHFHGIGYQNWLDLDAKTGWIKDAQDAQAEGLFKYMSFSFHSAPDDIKKLADTGLFTSLLCQYNLLDRANEQAMAYAHNKGLGVMIMGPVGGGRIAGFPEKLQRELNLPVGNNVEMALRFVLANPHVDCALSGMGTKAMVDENISYAGNAAPLSAEEIEKINGLMVKLKKMADLYCTGCKYCLPCPEGIEIPAIFELTNYYKVYGIKEHAMDTYAQYGVNPWLPKVKADACTKCGQCEERCPQHIEIRKQLEESHSLLCR